MVMGLSIIIRLEENILENGNMIRSMGKEDFLIKMVSKEKATL